MDQVKKRKRISYFPCQDKAVGIVRSWRGMGKLPLLDIPKTVKEMKDEEGVDISMISPGMADRLLNDENAWHVLDECPTFPTSAWIAFESPGQKLRGEIVHYFGNRPRVVMPTRGHRGQKDLALFVPRIDAGDIRVERGDFIIDVPPERLKAVPDFPRANGWYNLHESGIPHGREVDPSGEARNLLRMDSAFVGFLVRNVWGREGRRSLHAYHPMSFKCNMVVETSADFKRVSMIVPSRKEVRLEFDGIGPEHLNKLLDSVKDNCHSIPSGLIEPVSELADCLEDSIVVDFSGDRVIIMVSDYSGREFRDLLEDAGKGIYLLTGVVPDYLLNPARELNSRVWDALVDA